MKGKSEKLIGVFIPHDKLITTLVQFFAPVLIVGELCIFFFGRFSFLFPFLIILSTIFISLLVLLQAPRNVVNAS
ncbi:MAG: hypothetical protein KKH83_08095, partial [Candidatus Margulisbacteria bacterium]|nr:hypothetical protein [Candidatus Margulisiibacteriota bacterium]